MQNKLNNGIPSVLTVNQFHIRVLFAVLSPLESPSHTRIRIRIMLLSRLHLLLLVLDSTIVATTQAYVHLKAFEPRRSHPSLHANRHNMDTDCREGMCSRRIFFGSVAATTVILLPGTDAEARDELFKTNPLTNPVLEQVSRRCTESRAS